MAATVMIFAEYPSLVAMQVAQTLPKRTDWLTLKLIKDACEEIYGPIRRREEREQCKRDRELALPPPRRKRTPEEQARIDALVASTRAQFGIPERGINKSPPAAQIERDGRYADRIRDDLERRKLLNKARVAP